MDKPAIQYARTEDGVSIAYWSIGQGPIFVALYTSTGSHIGLEWQLPDARAAYERVAEGHRLVRLDFRNSGLSSRGIRNLSLEDHLGDLEAVIARLPDEPVALFAHAERAQVAVKYAAEHPDKVSAIVFSQPLLKMDDLMGDVGRAFGLIWPLMTEDWELYTSLASVIGWGIDDHERAAAWSHFMRDAVDPEDYRRLIAALAQNDVTELLSSVRARALIIHGTGPAFSLRAAQEIAGRVPRASLSTLNVRLTCWWDEEVGVDAVLRFLDEVTPAETANDRGSVDSVFQTIMFTDLESSTALTQKLGDEAAQGILHGHNDAVRKSLEEHGGREVKHTGDGIMAAFPSAVRAVEAALQIQRDLAGGEVRVRIGLNAGEPIAEDDDFFGTAVQLAARICDRAEPGQVLVSRVVADLCAGKKLKFEAAGEAHMKGFDEPVALFEVGH